MQLLMRLVVALCVGWSALYAGAAVFIVAEPAPPRVAVSKKMVANYAIANVTMTNATANATTRLTAMQSSRERLIQVIEKTPGFEVLPGQVKLSAQQGKLSSSFYTRSDIYLTILIDLNVYAGDYVQATLALRRLMDMTILVGKTKLQSGPVQLAVKDPEQYRPALLQAIHEDVQGLRARFGEGSTLAITGLEQAVKVSQFDDRHVVLYLDYRLSMEVSK